MSNSVAPLAFLLAAALSLVAVLFFLLRAKFAKQLSEVCAAHEARVATEARGHEHEMQVALEETHRVHSSELRELRSQQDLSLLRAQRDLQEQHAAALRKAEEQFSVRSKEQSQSALSVTIHPFVNVSRQRGLITSETVIELGYKYQLLIQGLPCFEPHTVVVETTKEKEVNDETIELLRSKVVEIAEIAAHAKGGSLGTVVSITKATVSGFLGGSKSTKTSVKGS